MITFDSLDIHPQILSALSEEGYTSPTPIQTAVIPQALEGRDILGCAQTGTGKTAAFSIPLLQRLSGKTRSHDPEALVITPTRELAVQVGEFIDVYGKNLKYRTAVLVGGMPMRPQIEALRRGTDIIIATPGRLLDLVHQKAIKLGHVEILILDEADRMLDMGFIPDVRHIMRLLVSRKQTLLLSATMPVEIARLANDFLRDPVRIEITPSSTPVDRVRQVIHPVDVARKKDLLLHLLREHPMDQVLIFTRTKHGADNLARTLEKAGHNVLAIHGDLPQSRRTKALESFKDHSVKILVATDVASRGLDVEAISHVINYDMPGAVEEYIHRIGRTARASAHGDAVSLVIVDDWDLVKEIEKTIGKTIERVIVPGFEPKVCAWLAEPPRAGAAKPQQKRRGLLRRRR